MAQVGFKPTSMWIISIYVNIIKYLQHDETNDSKIIYPFLKY